MALKIIENGFGFYLHLVNNAIADFLYNKPLGKSFIRKALSQFLHLKSKILLMSENVGTVYVTTFLVAFFAIYG